MFTFLGKKPLLVACSLILGATALAQGPDVVVHTLGGGTSSSNYNEFGPVGGVYAYSMSTTSCNVGTAVLDWFDNGSSGSLENHPVIGQQAYRLLDGKFEQVGIAWLKHGFCALSQPGCGSCQSTNCDTLGIGCADTYGAGLNDGPGLGPRNGINSQGEEHVNAASGEHGHPFTGSSSGSITGRMQIKATDVNNVGARYYFESHYIAGDDSAAGNHANNASYREVRFNNPTSVSSVGGTVVQEFALRAWRKADPEVQVQKGIVIDEGGPGAHGLFYMGNRVTDNGDGTWSYEYAFYNMTSNLCAQSLTIPCPAGVTVTNMGFHDVDHHGPGQQNGTDWVAVRGTDDVSWTITETYAQNQNANALRWGTLYNVRFVADAGPTNTTAVAGLFKPGPISTINIVTRGPEGSSELGTAFCFGDGTGNACPCGNTGGSGEGCATSTGGGMTLTASGSTSISSDDLMMTTVGVPVGNTGIVYAGKTQLSGNPLFDGLQCTTGNVIRFQGQLAGTSTVSDTGFVAQDIFGLFFVPGDTYYFQYFTRDNQTGMSPCSGFANLSNGYSVMMTL